MGKTRTAKQKKRSRQPRSAMLADPPPGFQAITTIDVSAITPAPYNPRTDLKPGDPAYEALARSLREFGCVEALVWNKRTGHLVAGHQRLEILKGEGAVQVQVAVVDLSETRERALNIALNKIAGDWDTAKLTAAFRDLALLSTADEDLDLTLTGFEDEAIAKMLADDDDGQILRQLDVREPPALTWYLIAIPTVKVGEISQNIEEIAQCPNVKIESTVTSGPA